MKNNYSEKNTSIIRRNNYSEFYCPNYLHSFATGKKRESHKKVCENKDFSNFALPSVTLTAEAQCSISFLRSNREFCLS